MSDARKLVAIMKTAAFVLPFAAALAFAQQPVPPKSFEVASVKPGTEPVPQDMGGGRFVARGGCQGGPGTSDPGRITCQNISLSNFVTQAYGLKRYQYITGNYPAWMDDTRFNITAKIPDGATKEDLKIMEQNLLAERFKLKVHFDKKEMPTYEMTVGKNGPKLTESIKGAAPAPAGPAPQFDPSKKDKDGFVVVPRTPGAMSVSMMGGRIRMQADDQTMEQFASTLTNQLGRPVIDATELKGKYDITLICAAESFGFANTTDGTVGTLHEADPAPTLFEAVQQQLGLKLDQKKGNIDVLVVEHAEKTPIEN